jgi:tetratricopeptide (TPR) repeat protein
MGFFEGEGCEWRALQAGLEMVRQIQLANRRQQWLDYPFAMSTRIGVHSGPVWIFQYAESPEDLQGKTVDIASRLVSLTGPNQILCTQEVYDAACKVGEFPKPRAELQRYLQGMDDPFALVVVMPEGFHYQAPDVGGLWPDVEKRLRDAQVLVDQRKYDEALAAFRQVSNEYRGDFAANICTAEQLLRDYGGGHVAPDEDRLREAGVYVGRALGCRPDSSHAWLLFGWLHFAYYTRSHKDTPRIREAIECARKAWRLAQASLNTGGTLQAQVCLIHFLYTRARHERDWDALDEARRLCIEVQPSVDRAFNDCRSDFYVVYASVQLLSGSSDFDRVREMLKMAKDFNPRNFRVYEVEQELARRYYPNGGVGGIFAGPMVGELTKDSVSLTRQAQISLDTMPADQREDVSKVVRQLRLARLGASSTDLEPQRLADGVFAVRVSSNSYLVFTQDDQKGIEVLDILDGDRISALFRTDISKSQDD